jgi:replicative DNA helicase
MKLSSIKVEQSLLGSLIKNSESFYDIDHFISEIDFTNDVNGTVYSVIRQLCNAKEKIDKVILAQKIQNLGISFQEDLDIYDYIDCLSLAVSNKESALKYAKELKQFSIRRDIKGMAQRIIETVSTNPEKNANQIIAEVDSIYGEKINSFDATEEIRNIFEDIEAFIEEKGNNPQDEAGIELHYPEFARLYGGLRNGNVYAIVSRPGQGKSSFLVEMSLGAYLKNKKVSVLYLDTEMFSQDVKLRIAAAKTGVPFWHIDTGNWRKDPEMVFNQGFLKRV